ncbi:MAG: hypothetical protein WEB60_14510 [Terrimicrobiaceae bacterium]
MPTLVTLIFLSSLMTLVLAWLTTRKSKDVVAAAQAGAGVR